MLDEQVMAALVGKQGEAQGGATELRRRRANAEVAAERQGKAGLDGGAVDRRDGQLVEVADGQVQRLGIDPERVDRADSGGMAGADPRHAGGCGLLIAAHVVAGAERPALAGEHQHAHGVVHLGLGDEFDEVALHRLVEGVHPLGRIEGDHQHAAVVQLGPQAGADPTVGRGGLAHDRRSFRPIVSELFRRRIN